MNFWLTVEKFINLQIPKKFLKIPILGNTLYFKLFSFLVFKFNPDKKTIKNYFLFVVLSLISYPAPLFLIIITLLITGNADFLRNLDLKFFNNYFIRHLIEIIVYSLLIVPYSYFSGFLQKIFHLYLVKQVKKNLGKLDTNNKFPFLNNFNYTKHYEFLCQRKFYAGVEKKHWYNPEKIIENIFIIIQSWWLKVNWNLPKYFAHIILEVFLFNATEFTNSNISKKNWKIFLYIYFTFVFIQLILTWYPFWIIYYFIMGHISEINGDLNGTNNEAIKLLLSGFFTIIFGFLMLPTAAYHPKLWITFWLFEK
ncbi:hypothetical protein [Mesomycoplasma ovipneumoniae]|uniref:hypothetical protein n=1 Tax=Mesomycoplasma ovipneumoniae TaxID=29562 RepID=UPI00083E7E28|nr:hypothetical protein [Mesomycoplasma ovipneumoniae]